MFVTVPRLSPKCEKNRGPVDALLYHLAPNRILASFWRLGVAGLTPG
jgi:hypothetical protein